MILKSLQQSVNSVNPQFPQFVYCIMCMFTYLLNPLALYKIRSNTLLSVNWTWEKKKKKRTKKEEEEDEKEEEEVSIISNKYFPTL